MYDFINVIIFINTMFLSQVMQFFNVSILQ